MMQQGRIAWAMVLMIAAGLGGRAAGQGHGVIVQLMCDSPTSPGQQLHCTSIMTYDDDFGDTVRIDEAFLIINPGPDEVRSPPVGNAPASFLGNARFAGVPGQLPVIIGAPGSTLNGLPGNPQPGAAVFEHDEYTVQLSDPNLLVVRTNLIAEDQCDDPGTMGCFQFPLLVQFTAATEIIDNDCNGNGIGDVEDIGAGTSPDCNDNLVPDECDEDENGDGVIEACDCNENGVLDAVDIAAGGSADENADGVPDECDAFAGSANWLSIGGLFGDPFNWVPSVPGPFNEAVFALNNSEPAYLVLFDANAVSSRATVSDGVVAFELAGFRYDLLTSVTPGLVVSGLAGDQVELQVSGGAITANAGQVASGSSSIATLRLIGDAASLSIQENLCVGCPGDGTLSIEDGAAVFCRDANLGELAGTGTIALSGAGSMLVAPFFIIVDGGTLDVGFGSTVSAGFEAFGGVFLLADGVLRGEGTVEGTVINFGRLVPGGAVGPLTVDGNYIQVGIVPGLGPSSGSMNIMLDTPGGAAPLHVAGDAELGGGLFAETVMGADPAAGQSFAILDATSVTDRFDVAFFPGLDGRILRVDYGSPLSSGASSVAIAVETFESLLGFDAPASASIDGTPVDVVATQLDDEPGSPLDLAVLIPNADPQEPGTLLVLFDVELDNGAITIGAQSNITVGVRPTAIAAGDLDGNGIVDLVVADGGDDAVRVLLTQPDRTLALDAITPVGDDPRDVAVADFDGDTFLDVLVASYGAQTVEELFNDGTGTLLGGGPIDLPGRPIAVDPETVDDDKDIDAIVVLQDTDGVALIGNDGDAGGLTGIVAILPVGSGPVDVIVTDLDGQETSPGVFPPEIITVNEAGDTVSVIINNGGLSFEPAVNLPVGDAPVSIATADLDQDGDVDIAVVAGATAEGPQRVVRVLRNDTDGGTQLILADAETFDFGDDPLLVASGDLDGDSDADLIAINASVGGSPFAGPASATLNAVPNTLFAPSCPGDSDGDGVVNVNDLNNVILDWGTDGSANGGDITGPLPGSPPDGVVNVNDLNTIIVGWGDCV